MARKDLTIEETLDYVMGTKDFIKQLITTNTYIVLSTSQVLLQALYMY